MQKNYYISDIQFHIDSEIPLDEYDAEIKFCEPVLPVRETYQVDILLADVIEVPGTAPIEMTSCRIWQKELDPSLPVDELRIYPYNHVNDCAISSALSSHQITISISRHVWDIYMHTFRIWSYIFLERILLENDALILHSASIIHRGKAILFTAPSETGKTTQTDIWHRNDASVTDLNGDRTILQKTESGWIACGIPISGTSTRCEQAAVPIAAIAFVNRAKADSVSQLSVVRKMQLLYGQITVFSANASAATKALALLEDLIGHEKIVQLNCTMNDSAYEVLLEELTQQS